MLPGGLGYDGQAEGLRSLEVISMLRKSQLSSPGNLPDNSLEGHGDLLGSSTQRPGACPCPCHAGFVMGLHPWSPVSGFWGQLQMHSWMRVGSLCPQSVWEGLGGPEREDRVCGLR